MTPTKNAGVIAGAAVMAWCHSGFAGTTDAENDALQTRIAELEATVAEMRAENGDGWLTEARADEIRTVVEDVLADADTRSSLLQGGGTAGWNDGFFLASADGNFRLDLTGYVQIRWALSYRDDSDVPTSEIGSSFGDTTQYGFEIPRAKLIFEGNVLNPQWIYRLQLNFGESGDGAFGNGTLEDAWVAYDYGNGWVSKVGQYKSPFTRESLVWDRRQLAVDSSVINDFYTDGRTQGISLGYQGDAFRFAVSYGDGPNTNNTSVIGGDSPFVGEAEFAITGRGEWLIAGNWQQFDDFVSWSGDGTGAMLGFAGSYTKEGYGVPTFFEKDEIFKYTVDFSYEGDGWSAYGAVLGATFDNADADPIGFLVQGAIFLNDDTDVFLRYEYNDFDVDGVDDLSLLGGGINVYLDGHDLKWTTDIWYNFDGGVPAPNQDFAGGDNELVIRSQLQLVF